MRICLFILFCLALQMLKAQNFYAGIDYNAQYSGLGPSPKNHVAVLLHDLDEESVMNINRGVGGHFGMYFTHKWHLETGIRFTTVSDGMRYEETSDDGQEHVEFTHESYQYLRFPFLLGVSTKSQRNFRFSYRMGMQYAIMLNAKNYIYDSQSPYYVNKGMGDLVPIEYSKMNGRQDAWFDDFLSYEEYYGLTGDDMSKYNRTVWYYHLEIAFEFRISQSMRLSTNFYAQAGLKRIHRHDYMAGPYNFWNEVFIAPEDQQIHRNKNFGAQFKLSYEFNFKKDPHVED